MMIRHCVLIAATVVSVACNRTAAPSDSQPAGYSPQPHSNLAQMMRGIPFTFSNIVFDAQSQDPATPRVAADTGGSAGATATFKNVYGGWQEVENSALAIAETANLVMIPGRLCENGKPVPIEDEAYRTAAQGLVAAGQAAYKAAQSKDLDAMVDVSDTVSMACANCHERYRDFDDPKDRCTPGGKSEAP
jgi:hypothetical protein